MEAVGISHNKLEPVDSLFIAISYGNITVFGSHQVFDESIYLLFSMMY